jgi:hypothetical protein
MELCIKFKVLARGEDKSGEDKSEKIFDCWALNSPHLQLAIPYDRNKR